MVGTFWLTARAEEGLGGLVAGIEQKGQKRKEGRKEVERIMDMENSMMIAGGGGRGRWKRVKG